MKVSLDSPTPAEASPQLIRIPGGLVGFPDHQGFEVFYRDPEVGGVHLEDTVLVTPTGLEHLSALPRELIITPA